MCAVWKQSSKRFRTYHPEIETIISHKINVNIRLKIKGKNEVKGHNLQKAHVRPLKDVCMQYQNNPAYGFWDIVQKWNTDAQTHGQTWWWQYPRPYFEGGE